MIKPTVYLLTGLLICGLAGCVRHEQSGKMPAWNDAGHLLTLHRLYWAELPRRPFTEVEANRRGCALDTDVAQQTWIMCDHPFRIMGKHSVAFNIYE